MKFFYYSAIIFGLIASTFANSAEMRVIATGEVKTAPDMTSFEFGVTSKDENSQRALNKNNETTTKILDILRKDKLAPEDIQTSSLLLYQDQDQNKDKVSKTIYAAENHVVVRIKDLNMLGTIYKDIVTNGATQTSNLVYSNKNTHEIYNKARIKAIHNAIEKANLLAKAANMKLGDIINIESYADRGNSNDMRMQTMAIGAEAATPIEEGVINYSADVTISFKLDK